MTVAARLTPTPGGARGEVSTESDMDEVLRALRASGARLVAIQPVGNPLEELFVNEQEAGGRWQLSVQVKR